MSGWMLHERLAADTHKVAALPLSDLLLMDDARYPWLILVPRVPAAVELIDLPVPDQHRLLQEVATAGAVLRALHSPDKLNIAALGNVVPQLHVHVVARTTTDHAWPRPVWGLGAAVPYAPGQVPARLAALRAALQEATAGTSRAT